MNRLESHACIQSNTIGVFDKNQIKHELYGITNYRIEVSRSELVGTESETEHCKTYNPNLQSSACWGEAGWKGGWGTSGMGENGRGAGERGRVVLAVNRPQTMQSFSQPTRPTSISQDFLNTLKSGWQDKHNHSCLCKSEQPTTKLWNQQSMSIQVVR